MSGSTNLPATMRAWQYMHTSGGLENTMKLNEAANLPVPGPQQSLVQVLYASINPVDYKPAEAPILWRLTSKPATPGIDFAGRIVTPSAGSAFKAGDLVCGAAGTTPFAGGALREYAIVKEKAMTLVPEEVSLLHAASVTVAGLTAYQTTALRVKKGDKIFINGGSGGTGIFGIQIAKEAGCHVTTTCSTTNVELCKSLGADEVIDYKKGNVLEALLASGAKFDHAVDNVGYDPELWWRCHEYLKPGARYDLVAGSPSFRYAAMKVWPGFLGGLKAKVEAFTPNPDPNDVSKILEWVKDGKVKVIIDQVVPFEDGAKAIAKLKTGRAKGKIVVNVAGES
ncbi:putative zinc-type alcohol dehydrogenase-like protein C16A3.02c [Bisporella sp. PMI_857]|nr:putative zinc-type alcohol dehydrogenase-like protein C16A3.02c [Bisporella sp. PMI_857]